MDIKENTKKNTEDFRYKIKEKIKKIRTVLKK